MNLNKTIKACQKNDRKAQFALYEAYAAIVIRTCERYTEDLPTAKDLSQLTFLKIFKNLNQFNAQKGNFESWIRRIAINECLQFLRKKRHLLFVEHFNENEMESVEELNTTDIDNERLKQFIEALPKGYRTIFLLFQVEEYSHKEIGSFLNISESTSRSQYFKARKMLKQKIEDFLSKKTNLAK